MNNINTATNSISIMVYSYKNKNVINTLEDMILKSSNNYELVIYWYDQNGLDRSKLLIDLLNSNKNCSGVYIPIHWDSISGPVVYKDIRLKSENNSKYFLNMSPGVIFAKDWDVSLIKFIENKKAVISGNNNIKILNSNLFFVKKENNISDNFTLTRYIDRNFIFGKTITMKESMLGDYNFPGWLKYYGEEEILSLQYFQDNIDIFSSPEDIIKVPTYTTLEDFNYYITFSKYHNYNEVISLFKNGYNNIINKIDKKIIKEFSDFHKFDFSSLSYLPFYTNDVLYESSSSKYDKIDGNRFLKPIRKVD